MNTLIKMLSSLTRHTNRDTAIETAEYINANILPSGSGFDNGTQFDVENSTMDKLVFTTSFHHMSEHGYYTKWTDHTVTVTPSFHGLNIKVSGRNRNDIKDHIAECFDCLLTSPKAHADMDLLRQEYVAIAKSNMT